MKHFFVSQRLIARRFTPLDLDVFVAHKVGHAVARLVRELSTRRVSTVAK